MKTNKHFYNNHKHLMVFGCHHKVGTSWFSKILAHVANEFELNFQYCEQSDLVIGRTDIFFQDHSRIFTSELNDYRGVHLIRDPRDLIVSGYHYHKWSDEEWVNVPRKDFGEMTYKEKINSLDQQNGLSFEMNHVGTETIQEMINWNYNDKNFLEVKYEDLLQDNKEVFRTIFQHYNFNEKSVSRCLEIVKNYSFDRMKKNSNSKHFRKGVSGDWKNHFDVELKQEFKTRFPDVLEYLGYEVNSEW